MDKSNYVEITQDQTMSSKRTPVNHIYITVKASSIHFTQSAIAALHNTPHVRLHVNAEDKMLLIEEADEGLSFLKEGRKPGSNVIWHNKAILDKVKDLLPEDRKEGVRVYGEVIDDEDTKGIVFNFEKVGDMKRMSRG